MTTPSDRPIPHYRCCGSPSTGGHYFEASGKDTPIYGASDYDLATALHGLDRDLRAEVAREWLVRNPTRPPGDKHWAQEAHTIATALIAEVG